MSIPALLCFINLIPYFSTPFENKLEYFKMASASRPALAYLFLPLNFQLSLIMLYNLGCLIYALSYLLRARRGNRFYIKKKVNVLINRLLMIIPLNTIPYVMVLIFLTSNSKRFGRIEFANPEAINGQLLFFLTLLLPISFFLIPSWLYNEKDPLSFLENFMLTWKRVVNETSKISEENSFGKSSDFERIISYIETEKPYIKTAFSLHDISQELNIPHNRVATCFNKQLKVAFSTYRNKLRIEHATYLLRSGTHLTTSIEGIAEMSGFKSKSIFYKIFKQEYGTTPIDWIKENLEI
jgi:AraC-like DNA-binding protein